MLRASAQWGVEPFAAETVTPRQPTGAALARRSNTRADMAQTKQLKKTLTLFDVYAISTGAMFSSGFFLLPGLATAQAGPAAVLAYFLAGVFILPAMFSAAELSTAMPKAGGAYYFLDRSLGPLAGTVGGLGTWLALVLKSAFALVGMGAYLVLFFDIPIKPLAVALTVAFAVLNVVGAKETSGLQRVLVTVLVGVLAFFVVQGLVAVAGVGGAEVERQFTPFLPFGTEGLLGTIGLVFVSYAGLTKVASVAEEVQNPDRNLPLGMILSLATATFIYCVGVFIMIAVLEPSELRSDLTPVATAAEQFFSWLPEPYGLLLIVAAAIAAFASTGNAGILAASRYPLAMARDHLVTHRLGSLGRFGTPVPAIVVTAGLMVFVILALDVEGIAKLASAFQLILFGLLNVAVIVMRESRIPSYLPGYRSPLYPWVQIVGAVTPVFLIAELGGLAIGLSLAMGVGGVAWYLYYVAPKAEVEREGAIYHLFARLGQRRYEGLDSELRMILKEKGLSDETPFEHLVTRATLLDLDPDARFEDVACEAAALLAGRTGLPSDRLEEGFLNGSQMGVTPVSRGVVLPHLRLAEADRQELVIVRSRTGLPVPQGAIGEARPDTDERVLGRVLPAQPEEPPGLHLRTLAALASRIDEAPFLDEWRAAQTEQDLKEVLIHNDRTLALTLRREGPTAALVGRALKEVRLPQGVLVALVHRAGRIAVPGGSTVLEAGDRLTIIGEPEGIRALAAEYRAASADA